MEGTDRNPTTRFSDRVENYIKYRPTYPPEVIGCLKENCGLTEEAIVADVGSGTGILTKLFLENAVRQLSEGGLVSIEYQTRVALD